MSTKEFVLKDSPPELVSAVGVQPQGRRYDKTYSEQPGAIRIDDVVFGMKCASLAITDDKADTLKKISKANPWHMEALRIITGSEECAHRPLSEILSTRMGLTCDAILDVNGIAKNGQFLDTQGYIAHNDSIIVLAYRCTTSGFDWLTNLSTTSSAWEPDVDCDQGHSGYCSGLEGLCCYDGEYRPRVHTGFYNNFLSTLPHIKEHILPLLGPDQPPRKLYVVGHSLGAGIATMAGCYLLLSHDWEVSPHKLLVITAGSPRACQSSMRDVVQDRMEKLRPLDKAVICRIVRDRDVVPTLPPSLFGFKHLDKLVYITDDGDILINPLLKDDHVLNEKEMLSLLAENPNIADGLDGSDDDDDERDENNANKKAAKSKYERFVSKIPAPFRDHMPDFYLKPLIKLFENESRTVMATTTTMTAEEAPLTSSPSNRSCSGGSGGAFQDLISRMKKNNATDTSTTASPSSSSSPLNRGGGGVGADASVSYSSTDKKAPLDEDDIDDGKNNNNKKKKKEEKERKKREKAEKKKKDKEEKKKKKQEKAGKKDKEEKETEKKGAGGENASTSTSSSSSLSSPTTPETTTNATGVPSGSTNASQTPESEKLSSSLAAPPAAPTSTHPQEQPQQQRVDDNGKKGGVGSNKKKLFGILSRSRSSMRRVEKGAGIAD